MKYMWNWEIGKYGKSGKICGKCDRKREKKVNLELSLRELTSLYFFNVNL